ncbi:cytochrome ubiquinol oxidase subunit I [Streptomyces sp. NPDC058642]|uniref:cytochrome ubiquinol oxidase subunit I n=1 Tax=Streptomyces sp. NPDC058642 TaxID=3346572 RepID=UPI00366A1FD1
MARGLSILLSVVYGLYWRTGRAVYLQMFRFWRRIFAVRFAIGVVVAGASSPPRWASIGAWTGRGWARSSGRSSAWRS